MRRAVLAAAVVGGGLVWFWLNNREIKSPFLRQGDKKKEEKLAISGFLPSWGVVGMADYSEKLDELVFLGVGVDRSGGLIWDNQAKMIYDAEFLRAKERMKKVVVGIKMFDDDDLDAFLADKLAWEKLVVELESLVAKEGLRGVNVDFEYQSDPKRLLADDFFEFLGRLKEAEIGEVGVDVFANTVIKGLDEKLIKLVDSVDSLVIMAYDFHYPGVDYAGAVAPIRAPTGERSIWEVAERLVELSVDRKKIVLAYPFYGYEWKTETQEYGSKIIRGWYATASYKRVKRLIERSGFRITDLRRTGETDGFLEENEMVLGWDKLAMSPWLVYKKDGEIRQIYYEDEESLRIKMDLAKDLGVGGVNFWALGYEGGTDELWKVIKLLD